MMNTFKKKIVEIFKTNNNYWETAREINNDRDNLVDEEKCKNVGGRTIISLITEENT